MTISLNSSPSTVFPTTRPVSLPDRCHPEKHLLFWQYRGNSTFSLNEKHYSLQAQQALWLPANTVHNLSLKANSLLLRIFFPTDLVKVPPEMDTIHSFHVSADQADLFMSVIQSDSSLIHRAGYLEQHVLDQLAKRRQTLPWPSNAAARKIAEVLTENPGDTRTLDELAQLAHASSRTIERAFFDDTGVTFRDWRLQCRINEAKRLLSLGRPTDAVAFRVGYSTTSSFGRAFKRHTGISPGSYAEQVQMPPFSTDH